MPVNPGYVAVLFWSALAVSSSAAADPLLWPQPGGPGMPVQLSYSYSNLLDGELQADLSTDQLRAAAEESLGLWAAHAPLFFRERPDIGPPPSDSSYSPDGHPDIRIGHHGGFADFSTDEIVVAHAFFPSAANGLGGDVHLRTLEPPREWTLGTDLFGIDLLETLTHELGHALGLPHIAGVDAIMNLGLGNRFDGLGSGFLLPPDIEGIQALYGAGRGAVSPIPEPSTFALLAAGLALLGRDLARRKKLGTFSPRAAARRRATDAGSRR